MDISPPKKKNYNTNEKNPSCISPMVMLPHSTTGKICSFLKFQETIPLRNLNREFREIWKKSMTEIFLRSADFSPNPGLWLELIQASLEIETISSFKVILHEWMTLHHNITFIDDKKPPACGFVSLMLMAEIIFHNSSTLKKLDISTWEYHNKITSKSVLELIKMPEKYLQLSSLSLKLNSTLTIEQNDWSLPTVVAPNRFPSLLDLELSVPITHIQPAIKSLLQSAMISQLQRLTVISHEENDSIDIWGTVAQEISSSQSQFPNLRQLELSFTGFGQNQFLFFVVLCEKFPGITSLAISPCHPDAFENANHLIGKNHLQRLVVELAHKSIHSSWKSQRGSLLSPERSVLVNSLGRINSNLQLNSLRELYLFDITSDELVFLSNRLCFSILPQLSSLYVDLEVFNEIGEEEAAALACLLQNCKKLKELYVLADNFTGIQGSDCLLIESACNQLKLLSFGPSLSFSEVGAVLDGLCLTTMPLNQMHFYFQPNLDSECFWKFPYTGPNKKKIGLVHSDIYGKKMEICKTISTEDFNSVAFYQNNFNRTDQTANYDIVLYSSEISADQED